MNHFFSLYFLITIFSISFPSSPLTTSPFSPLFSSSLTLSPKPRNLQISELQVNSYAGAAPRWPSIASFSDGGFGIVWGINPPNSSSVTSVFAKTYSSNITTILPDFQANTYHAVSQSFPTIAELKDRSFVVAWYGGGSGNSAIKRIAMRLFYQNGTARTAEIQVNTYNQGENYPSIAVLPSGNFVIVWEGKGASTFPNKRIAGQMFTPNGTAIGPEFDISTYNATQEAPAIATLKSGAFVVVWYDLLLKHH